MTAAHPDDERWIAYALQDVDPSERAVLDEHKAGCSDCSLQVERLTALLESERSAPAGGAPVRVLVAILSRQARAQHLGLRLARRWLRPVPALVGAGLAVILFGAGYLQGRHAHSAAPARGLEAGRSPRSRVSLPAPPPLPVETAMAAGGDLALARWGEWQTAATDSTMRGDSL